MVRAVGEMLPGAMAVALSPFVVIAIVVLLAHPRGRGPAWAFTLGWVVGLSALTAVAVFASAGTSDPDSSAGLIVSSLRVVVGILLLWAAWKKWASRPREGGEPPVPGWMRGLSSATLRSALGIGLALSVLNPKTIALTLSATASISEAGLAGAQAAFAAAIYVVLASVGVLGAVAAKVFGGTRADAALAGVERFMVANSIVITVVILLLIGANILGDGLRGLGS